MMKSGFLLSIAVFCCTALSPAARAQSSTSPPPAVTDEHLKKAGIKPIGDWQVDPAETQQINQMFATAFAAANSLPATPDSPPLRRAINNELRNELESFIAAHPNSAYVPSLDIWLGQQAALVSGYSLALQHYQHAFEITSSSGDPTAITLAVQAGAGLSKMLAITGRIDALDAVRARAVQIAAGRSLGGDWKWARELRTWVAKHPDEAYKCGLYCLDQLSRLTQPGQIYPKNITETQSSLDGFTAADLLTVAGRAGLRIHAAVMTDTNNVPVPSIIHLRSDHFVFVRALRGGFYEVIDPVAFAPKFLTAADIFAEATGCVLVSDVVPPTSPAGLVAIDANTSATFRGRCHGGLITDQNDPGPCPNPSDPTPQCCTGDDGSGGSGPGGSGPGGSGPGGSGQQVCHYCLPACGAPNYMVSQPYVTLWLYDNPMPYKVALGPPMELYMTRCARFQQSALSGNYWYGIGFGDAWDRWTCPWFSFAELSTDGNLVDLLLPASGWAMFAFTNNSTYSTMNYQHNFWLEKQGPNAGSTPGNITNLVLHYPDGSQINYGLKDPNASVWINALFYMTSRSDALGNSASFSYDGSFHLQTATAADGTYFTLTQDGNNNVTNVTSSYGATASFSYFLASNQLTNIVDAAGIQSAIVYATVNEGDPAQLITPYGTTSFNNNSDDNLNGPNDNGVFDRYVRITNAVGQVEFYGLINAYTNTDWTNFVSSQIPTNTPLGTLDSTSGERQERNTFYWNPVQFAPYVGTPLTNFNWPIFMQSRIRHWLAATDPTYTHFDSLSIDELPSADGVSIGQLTWYDYAGKPPGVNYETGTQIQPSVIARVMPDGSTWYQYYKRLTNGLPTSVTEAWIDSGTVHTRSNVFVWDSNNIDLLSWTNAAGVTVLQNQYNSVHQVVTNYDALGQLTTNGYDSTTRLLTSRKNPAGLVSLYSYTAGHRISSIVDLPVNRTNGYTWNSDGTMATHTDPRNMVESYFWDSLHRLTGTSDGRGSTTNLYYILSGIPYPNSSGGTALLDITATRDRLGNWTSFVYDALRRKVTETNANGVVTGYGYCPCGAVSYVTNAWNTAIQEVTVNNFDQQGRLINTTFADGYSLTNWYDVLGRIIVTGDGAALRWLFYNNINFTAVPRRHGS